METIAMRKRAGTGYVAVIFIIMLLQSCGISKDTNRADINSMEDLNELVNTMQFEIRHEYAQPMSSNQVDLIGNPNFIRFNGDNVDLFLPYFGVRYMGGDYGSREGGIEYEGLIENLDIEETDKNIMLNFEADEDGENYSFQITLFPNGRATTSVTSSERQSISYRGHVYNRSDQE